MFPEKWYIYFGYGLKVQLFSPSSQSLPFQVCREFQRGNCARGETDCRFAHPSDSPMIDSTDNTVTVCMDYIKSRCSREKCKYFHPPAHLQAKIKSSQQVSQTGVAAQATAAAMVRQFFCLFFSLMLTLNVFVFISHSYTALPGIPLG